MVYLTLLERIMVQVLKITWCKDLALAEVSNISSHQSEIIEAVVWLNERFKPSRKNWVLQNSILISKTLTKRFKKHLKIYARVIIRCLRNHLLNYGRKPNTEWSQAFNNVVQSDTSAQVLERKLLTPDQIDSQDYSRDRAKVVPRGSTSPTVPHRFKPLFSLDGNVADSEPYKALAELARAANTWSQFKRNLPPDGGKKVLKELATRIRTSLIPSSQA